MAGVKVIMIRTDASGIKPAERLFDSADNWAFGYDRNISTLHIVKEEGKDSDEFKRITIAEFPASGIESVEFA